MPNPAHCLVITADDDRVVLYGGVDPVGGSTVFNDIWILDPTTWQWSKPPIKNSPSKGHWAHASSMVGNLMVVMFGTFLIAGVRCS